MARADGGRLAPAAAGFPPMAADRSWLRFRFLRPPLIIALVAMWVAGGLVSLNPYRIDENLGLAALAAGEGTAAWVVLFGASLWDMALGLALIVRRHRRLVGWLQVATIVAYSAIATVTVPALWLDPFGALVKNAPVVMATLVMIATEGEG